MPAIDTQAPLMRRKALIEKLMTQLSQQGGQQSGINAPQITLGKIAGNAMPGKGPGSAGTNPLRPENLEPRSALIQGLQPAHWMASNQTAPDYQAPNEPVAQQPAPAPPPPVNVAPAPSPAITPGGGAAPLPTWQQQNFLSESAMNAFMQMSESEQARVMANPVYRRRYYNT